MARWQEIPDDEFFRVAALPEVRERANEYHTGEVERTGEHSLFHSCPCAHLAVEEYLTRQEQ